MRTFLFVLLFAPAALAQEDLTRVDEGPPPPRRWLTISYSPLTLQLQRYGGNIELAPLEHHAITGTLYYAQAHTNDGNTFSGVGGEAGYRYYFGAGGARGVFIGPSFLFGSFEAALDGGRTKEPYATFGGALDLGYQALVADRWLICLGLGAQYTHVTATFPTQDFFAQPIANAGILPRLLFSLGFAL